MTLKNATIQAGYEPIAGYVLRKRLGAGGYGEVWQADAPGGLQKAVKLIFGAATDLKASRELRSLERISKVHHPFILSLERIEVIQNQVVIVSELAEGSLQDRFERCRRDGAPGIPRAELLDFIRDIADTLDFLAQKHSLQHLDIKPENLLTIADRIKVADFGLVKNLGDQDMSLAGGLTPAYSAPEVFDGMPDYRSDQYSLAIVFMEMLTGQLPFTGKNPSELARQHIGQTPNLDALPPADRPFIARALSKNPVDRFTTCRQFVDQLINVKYTAIPDAPKQLSAPDLETVSTHTQNTAEVPRSYHAPLFQQRLEAEGHEGKSEETRCVFVGLGGIASEALVVLRQLMLEDCDGGTTIDDHRWLAIDTDTGLEDALCNANMGALDRRDVVCIPILRPSDYRSSEPDLYSPLSRRWLYNIPKSRKTEGVRPLALLSLLRHYDDVRNAITNAVRELAKECLHTSGGATPVRAYIVSSLHGGTGGGLLAEVGLLLRKALDENGLRDVQIGGFGSLAESLQAGAGNMAAAAALATLSEIELFMSPDSLAAPLYYKDQLAGPIRHKPLDWLTLVDGGVHSDPADRNATVEALANCVLLDSRTAAGATLKGTREQQRHSPLGWLRAQRAAALMPQKLLSIQQLSDRCCTDAIDRSISYLLGSTAQTQVDSSIADVPLTENAQGEFAARLLTELGFDLPIDALQQLDGSDAEQQKLMCWKNRINHNLQSDGGQLEADLRTWRAFNGAIAKQRMYNWAQLEQIQLSGIERLIEFIESDLQRVSSRLGTGKNESSSSQTEQKLSVYLKTLVENCLQIGRSMKQRRTEIATELSRWKSAIVSEYSSVIQWMNFEYSSMPRALRRLAESINAELDTRLHQLSQSAFEANAEPALPCSLDDFRNTAVETGTSICQQLNIDPDSSHSDARNSDEPVLVSDLGEFFPGLADSAGSVYRIATAPANQMEQLRAAIQQADLEETTTLITSHSSLEAHIVCDVANLNLASIASVLWRANTDTFALAERLRTRADVNWPPIQQLLTQPDSNG